MTLHRCRSLIDGNAGSRKCHICNLFQSDTPNAVFHANSSDFEANGQRLRAAVNSTSCRNLHYPDSGGMELRKMLTAKIASGEWDGIVVTHSSFERIGMSKDYQEQFLREQIAEDDQLLIEHAAERGYRVENLPILRRVTDATLFPRPVEIAVSIQFGSAEALIKSDHIVRRRKL